MMTKLVHFYTNITRQLLGAVQPHSHLLLSVASEWHVKCKRCYTLIFVYDFHMLERIKNYILELIDL
jgi:hypothetical protein